MAQSRSLVLNAEGVQEVAAADTLLVGSGVDASAAQPLVVGGAVATGVTLGRSGQAVTVPAGATLQTAGTGNVDLPNNASARFKVEGAPVAASVTAANLGALTAGAASNADALHTHALQARGAVVDDGYATTGLAAGDVAYVSAANTLAKTDSAAAASSRAVGVFAGTAGELVVAGRATVRFTTAGGQPANGAEVFLAAAADDTNAGAGKLTAAPPAAASNLWRAPVAVVRDNALYASAKTCVVVWQPRSPVQRVS